MSNILLGLALISASLQTSWAMLAEGQVAALPLVVLALVFGVKILITGFSQRHLYRI